LRIFKARGVVRFARRERIVNKALKDAIARAERGTIDADLGDGLIKQRVARPGQGRSGGYRMIVAYRAQGRAVFLFGFAKNDLDNITPDRLQTFRAIGANWLAASAEILAQAVDDGDLEEIEHDDDNA
jgi:hypothetical protein